MTEEKKWRRKVTTDPVANFKKYLGYQYMKKIEKLFPGLSELDQVKQAKKLAKNADRHFINHRCGFDPWGVIFSFGEIAYVYKMTQANAWQRFQGAIRRLKEAINKLIKQSAPQ